MSVKPDPQGNAQNEKYATETCRHFNTTTTSGTPLVTVTNQYLYDQIGRKSKTWEQITNGTTVTTRTLLSQLNYNELGQPYIKQLHSTDSVNFLQPVTYAYTERGWLQSSTSPLFTMQLSYNSGTHPEYNGNISNQSWSS